MIKGAIFDVDGTLLDSMEIWESLGVRYLQGIGMEPEKDLGKILYPMTIEEGVCYVKKQYGLIQDTAQITQEVLSIVRDFYYNEAALKQGALELLERLAQKGIPMAAATSGDRDHVEAAFRRLGISRYFKTIFTCAEVGKGKMNPLIYQMAAESLGTEPEETYVFEDVLYAIQTANKAGFHTVAVYDRFSEQDREEIKKQAEIYLPDFTKNAF